MRYFTDAAIKKRLLGLWLNDKEGYQKKRKLSNILNLAAILFWLTIVVLFGFIAKTASGVLMGAGAGFIFGCIPFCVGQILKNQGKREYGFPYIKMEQEVLSIYEKGIEFIYHNTESKNGKSMDVYRISNENINAVNYDSKFGVVTIIGEASFTAYDDYFSNRINYEKSQRKFYANTPYTFIMAHEERDMIAELLQTKVRNGGMTT